MKKCFLLKVALLLSWSLFAQEEQNEGSFESGPEVSIILGHIHARDTPFWAIQTMGREYISTCPEDKRFAVEFARWTQFWESRVNNEGDIKEYGEKIYEFSSSQTGVCQTNGDWSLIGPYLPSNHTNTGRLVSVYSNQSVPSDIYADSNAGGLWKTTDGGQNWICKTDGLGIPAAGVTSIAGDKTNSPTSQTLYIAMATSPGGWIAGSFFFADFGMGVWKSTDGGDTWVPSLGYSPWYGEVIDKLITLPGQAGVDKHKTVYAIGKNTVWKTWDAGLNWHTVLHQPGANFYDLEVMPGDTNTIFVSQYAAPGGGNIIKITQDLSDPLNPTWSNTPLTLPSLNYHFNQVLPSGNILPTWTTNISSYQLYFAQMAVCPATPNTLYAIISVYQDNSNNFYREDFYKVYLKTSDYGQTWTQSEIPRTMSWTNTGFSPATPLSIYSSYFENIGGLFEINELDPNIMYSGVFFTTRTTDQWATTTTIDPTNNSTSITYENTQIQASGHMDTRDLLLFESSTDGVGDKLLLANDGGLMRTINGGSGWDCINGSSLVINQVLGMDKTSASPDFIVSGMQDNHSFIIDKTTDPPTVSVRHGGDGGEASIDEIEPDKYYVRGNEWIYGGNLPDNFNSYLITYMNADYTPYPIMHHPQNHTILYAARNQNFYTFDLAANTKVDFDFKLASLVPDRSTTINTIDICKSTPNVIYAAFNSPTPSKRYLFRSDDGGLTWVNLTLNPSYNLDMQYYNINTILVDPDNPNNVWAGMSGFFSYPGAPIPPNWDEGAIRVFHSTDAGITWTDISLNNGLSNGLPIFPVNILKYQEGSNGVLWAGTDIGVYRYDPDNNIWECYSNGIPITVITDIEFDYCRGKIYASTYGRGIYEGTLPSVGTFVLSNDMTIHSGEVRNFYENITIPPGKKMTVYGMLNMAEGKQIVVQPGAELEINGGKITNRCGQQWRGISVLGDRTASQDGVFPNCVQGRVYLLNDAVIEHAYIAVANYDEKNADFTTTGGIIEAENSTFLNNLQDVQMMDYQNYDAVSSSKKSDRTHFTACTFRLDEDYRTPIASSRVYMYGVRTIAFKGCTFENLNADLRANLPLKGIHAWDANFELSPTCNCTGPYTVCPFGCTESPSRIKNFYKGIEANHITYDMPFRVAQTEFSENQIGIAAYNANDISIVMNDFNIGDAISQQQSIGVYIETGTRFTIEENIFHGPVNPNVVMTTIGLIVENTGPNINRVYKNLYHHLTIANTSIGRNRDSGFGWSGLGYACNDQTFNFWDIAVEKDPTSPSPIDGIAALQGWIDYPDNNKFLPDNGVSNKSDYLNNAAPLARFYTVNTLAPIDNLGTSTVYQYLTSGNEGCPSTLTDIDPVILQTEKTSYFNHLAELNNNVYLYEALIDDGNTQGLLANVENNWADNAWEMRNELMQRSPNLSREVLAEAAMSGVMPHTLLMEVLLANARNCQDEEFIAMLAEEIPNPLPQTLLTLLSEAIEPLSIKMNLESAIAYHQTQRSLNAHNVIRYYLTDSLSNDDSLKVWLSHLHSLHANYSLAEYYLNHNQWEEAEDLIALMPSVFPFSVKRSDEHNAYAEIMTLKHEIIQSGRNWKQLTSAEIAQLQAISTNTHADAAVQARNILCLYSDSLCNENLPPAIPSSPARKAGQHTGSINALLTKVTISPNPAKEYMSIQYHIPESSVATQLLMMSASGAPVQQVFLSNNKGEIVLNTEMIPSGIYFVVLKSAEKVLYSGSVSIMK